MPIYAYRCESCGFGKDILRKLSDAPLTQCPECGKHTFAKQVTAAGFQLKGSGWYVTDFRGGNNGGKSAPAATESTGAEAAKSESATADSGSKPAAASAPTESSSGAAAASTGTSASSGAA
ncbi:MULTISPECIES: FmdB family zinc ribbon protein [unclassified Caballeronia]|uniref:FmdB family zinc ribbon protein n=1 Tax=unclassified Caballeronia TaxID=2646786 RepID=UPI00285B774E|nr:MULTISPECIES: FmdB family zinc ribbon protein [unclassified Caballeronia]MDR5749530.1 zinc ribbon domain-containing protein [Caballeronia sp. LZ024]MDR5843340.1 zinc ribbon domain-containing protein [Caballeronia sp. LZ031]